MRRLACHPDPAYAPGMANPEHVPLLDGFDRLTVVLYRLGIAFAAVGLVAVSAVHIGRALLLAPPSWALPLTWGATLAAVALSAANLHLYDKRIRWVLAGSTPLGLVLFALGEALPATWWLIWPLQVAGMGFVFVTLSGIALKERFCFRIPGLRLVPVFLAGGLIPVLIDWPIGIAVAYAPAALVVGWLAVAKWTQPLHFDVGDKSRYAV